MNRTLLVILMLISTIVSGQPKPGTIYPTGKPGVNYNLLNAKGKKDGLWVRSWESTKNIFSKGEFKNGIPVGEWQKFYPDGALMSTMLHVKDTTVIDATFYHPDGKTKMSSGRFINRKKEGKWDMYNEAGVLISEENFKDSLLHGTCKYFYPSGKPLKIEDYQQGLKAGAFTDYYENGKKRAEGTNSADEHIGPYKSWFENGILECEGKYSKGLQDGSWYFNHKDGKPEVSVLFSMGKEVKRKYENGTFKEYYDSGIPKSEYSYENGMKEGPFTEWYDKGEYVQVPGTKEDQEVGIVYREKLYNTQIKVHGDYVGDQLEGEVIYYRENGSVEKVEEWSGGQLIKTRAAAK